MHPTPTAPAATPVAARHLLDQPYVTDGDPAQTLDLTVPGGHVGPRPVVIFVHGGAWNSGEPRSFESSEGSNFAALRSVLLAQGWATASVGYRLSNVARMPAQLDDVKAATRWLYAHAGRYGLDRDHIAIVGESAGGHLAQLMGDTRGRAEHEGDEGITGASSDVVAVVSFYGVSDLAHLVADRVAAGCGPGDAGAASPEAQLIGIDPASSAGRQPAVAASPITYITPTAAPTLFLHGTKDCIVPIAQSERAARALREAGVATEVTPVEGAGHADPEFYTTPALQQEVIDFLARYLGAR